MALVLPRRHREQDGRACRVRLARNESSVMKRARAGEKLRLVPSPEEHTTDPAGWRDAVQEGAVTLAQVEQAAEGCRACDLWKRATQTVFGRGPVRARVM